MSEYINVQSNAQKKFLNDYVADKSAYIIHKTNPNLTEIASNQIPEGKVFFFDKDGKELQETSASSEALQTIPTGTARVVANGDFTTDQVNQVSGIEIFVKGNFKANEAYPNAKIIATGDAEITNIAAANETIVGGNFKTNQPIMGDVSAAGNIDATSVNIGDRGKTLVFAGKDINLTGDTSRDTNVVSGGNLNVKGNIYGEASAVVSISANNALLQDKLNTARLKLEKDGGAPDFEKMLKDYTPKSVSNDGDITVPKVPNEKQSNVRNI